MNPPPNSPSSSSSSSSSSGPTVSFSPVQHDSTPSPQSRSVRGLHESLSHLPGTSQTADNLVQTLNALSVRESDFPIYEDESDDITDELVEPISPPSPPPPIEPKCRGRRGYQHIRSLANSIRAKYNKTPPKSEPQPESEKTLILKIAHNISQLEQMIQDNRKSKSEREANIFRNRLINELKTKLHLVEASLNLFGNFSSQLGKCLVDLTFITSRNVPQSEHLSMTIPTVELIKSLFDQFVDAQLDDQFRDFVRDKAEVIVLLLTSQLNYVCQLNDDELNKSRDQVLNFVRTTRWMIAKVLTCLEYDPLNPTSSSLSVDSIVTVLESLHPFEMFLSEFPFPMFWNSSKWFFNPSSIILAYLKLANKYMDSQTLISENYLIVRRIYDSSYSSSRSSGKTANQVLFTFWCSISDVVGQMEDSKTTFDAAQIDSIMFELYRMLQLYNSNFSQLRLRNMVNIFVDLIVNQFGERLWEHCELIDCDIEEKNKGEHHQESIYLFDLLQDRGLVRDAQPNDEELLGEIQQLLTKSQSLLSDLMNKL